MAINGQINTNTTYDSYFWVRWAVGDNEQDVAGNRTFLHWSCGVYCGHSFYLNAIKMSGFYIDGILVYQGGTYSNFSKGDHQIAAGSLYIPHHADGTKTFNISSFTGWLYSNYNYSSNGGKVTLPAIPREATITAADNFTDLQIPTVTYSNPAGNNVESLDICICDTSGWNTYVAYRAVNKTGTLSYTFTADDVTALKNITGNTLKLWFLLRTKIGGKYYYSHAERTFTVTENSTTKPTVTMEVTLNNGSLPSVFAGQYIQGKSRADIKLSATGKFNATIDNYSATVDDKTYNAKTFTSDVIRGTGDVDIVGSAKDSRGFRSYETKTINVIAYSKPTVVPHGNENAILCYRSDGNGKRTGNSTSVWIKAKRAYYKLSSGTTQRNFCALQWRRKLVTEEWNDSTHLWNNLLSRTSTTDEYNALLPGIVFDVKRSYTVQIRAIDDIGEYDIKTFEIPTQDVALHLGKGGKNVAVGTYCDYSEDYTFYSEWKAIFDKGFVDGSDTKWTDINSCIAYRCKCGYVTVLGISEGEITLTSGDYATVGTVPSPYNPGMRVPVVFHTIGGSPVSQAGYVETDGSIRLFTNVGGTSYWAFSVTYPI